LTVTSYNARYIHQYVHLFTTPITIRTPLVLDCPHSQRTLRTPCVSFTLLYVSVHFPDIHITRPTAPRDPPSITGLPRRPDVVAVAPTASQSFLCALSHKVSSTFPMSVTRHQFIVTITLVLSSIRGQAHGVLGLLILHYRYCIGIAIIVDNCPGFRSF